MIQIEDALRPSPNYLLQSVRFIFFKVCFVFWVFFKILFIYSWETQRESQRHTQREKQALHREPEVGRDPRPRIKTWAEGRCSTAEPPGIPTDLFSKTTSLATPSHLHSSNVIISGLFGPPRKNYRHLYLLGTQKELSFWGSTKSNNCPIYMMKK